MTDTFLNAVAVLVGTSIGTLLGDRLPERVRDIALQGVGLVTLLIGTQMALQAQKLLIVLASMVVGRRAGVREQQPGVLRRPADHPRLGAGRSAEHQVPARRLHAHMTAVGGLLILAIGFKLLDIKSIRVGSFLPTPGLAPVLNAVSGAVR